MYAFVLICFVRSLHSGNEKLTAASTAVGARCTWIVVESAALLELTRRPLQIGRKPGTRPPAADYLQVRRILTTDSSKDATATVAATTQVGFELGGRVAFHRR
jgi:hypothetical protein